MLAVHDRWYFVISFIIRFSIATAIRLHVVIIVTIYLLCTGAACEIGIQSYHRRIIRIIRYLVRSNVSNVVQNYRRETIKTVTITFGIMRVGNDCFVVRRSYFLYRPATRYRIRSFVVRTKGLDTPMAVTILAGGVNGNRVDRPNQHRNRCVRNGPGGR